METDSLSIDGAMGEGGGQVLRSSLTLSILTGRPVHLFRIRAGRAKPGLQPQHLKAVEAAAAICSAETKGAALHSQELFFRPGSVRGGRYRFDIGTAGSSSLVLQTIALPLALAAPLGAQEASTVTITGGTHVPFSPCYHYLERAWLPVLKEIGVWMRMEMTLAGFYPQGGGKIEVQIRPQESLHPITRIARDALVRIRGISAVANLDETIARRQKHQALRRLEPICADTKIETNQMASPGKGTMLLLQAQFGESTCCYFGLGAIGKRAEQVADEAVDGLEGFLSSSGSVDEHLADQLLLPLAFTTGTSRFRTARITPHLLTNAGLIELFLPGRVRIEGVEGQSGEVIVIPHGLT